MTTGRRRSGTGGARPKDERRSSEQLTPNSFAPLPDGSAQAVDHPTFRTVGHSTFNPVDHPRFHMVNHATFQRG
jgi:hypothetical protein